MIMGVIDQQVEEHFTVADTNGNLVPGIDTTSFTIYIYDPNGIEVSASVSSSIIELGENITHPTYFPWGKNDDIQVYNGDISDVYDNVIKTLGLVHHNFYIDNTTYDEFGNMTAGRVRIYSDATSVGTDVNVIETYLITADGTECGKFNYWAQVKM